MKRLQDGGVDARPTGESFRAVMARTIDFQRNGYAGSTMVLIRNIQRNRRRYSNAEPPRGIGKIEICE